MKLGKVTKLNKRNTTTLKKNEYDVMLTNCDVIVFFPPYGKFAAIRKLDSGCMACTNYILINNNLFSSKKPFSFQKLKTEVKNL